MQHSSLKGQTISPINIPEAKQSRLWAYVAGICKHENIFVVEIGGTEDHIHLQIPPPITLSKAVITIKVNSSRWMGDKFSWQQGYAAFSVSASNIPAVSMYIKNKKARKHITGRWDSTMNSCPC